MTKNTEVTQQNNQVATVSQEEIISSLVLQGDLSKMTNPQKVEYYNAFCRSLQLNPLTQPFELITLNGKLRMYAKKDCTDQLRKIHSVSITDLIVSQIGENYIVIAKGVDKTGRVDTATAVINVKGMGGDNLANAMMKCESKAKRRLTLSLCGLGILDETEIETVNPNESPKANNSMNINATPDAPPESAKATNEDIDLLIELLDNEALGEVVFGGIKKDGMKKTVQTKFDKGTLEKHKAEEYIAGLKEQITLAGGSYGTPVEIAEEVPESDEPDPND